MLVTADHLCGNKVFSGNGRRKTVPIVNAVVHLGQLTGEVDMYTYGISADVKRHPIADQ